MIVILKCILGGDGCGDGSHGGFGGGRGDKLLLVVMAK